MDTFMIHFSQRKEKRMFCFGINEIRGLFGAGSAVFYSGLFGFFLKNSF